MCHGKVGTISKSILKALTRVNCEEIILGIESGNNAILRGLNKKQKVNDILRTVKLIKESGINIGATFIIGSPHENVKTFLQTLKLLFKINPTYAVFNILTPLPGTILFEYMKKENLIVTYDWSKFDAMSGYPVIRSFYLDPHNFRSFQRIAYFLWYLYKLVTYVIIQKIRDLLNNFIDIFLTI